jgi:hypothetical protein
MAGERDQSFPESHSFRVMSGGARAYEDDEPSLGSVEGYSGIDQSRWGMGGTNDCEDEGAQCDDEGAGERVAA